jgi:hypothetical protein
MWIIFGIKKENQPGRKWTNGQSLPLLGQEKNNQKSIRQEFCGKKIKKGFRLTDPYRTRECIWEKEHKKIK